MVRQYRFPIKKLCLGWVMGLFLFLSLCLCQTIESESKEPVPGEDVVRFLSREIESQVQDQTGSEGVRLRFDPRCLSLLPSLKEGELRVEHVTVDQHRYRFTATVSSPDGLKPFTLKGGFSLSVKLPFVVRSIAPGQVIQENDLEWNTVEIGSNLRNAVLKMADLVDKTPRQKNLEPGQLIKVRDIQNPVLVKKNEMVTLLYQKNDLTIEQQGKSLDDGGAGDTVRVLNPVSRKPIVGTVTARKQVKVGNIA
jgi:flagellar basal body P-ring formation protein FlgA